MLVSGRTFEQVIEAARIFAADGAIAELGATVAWDAGRGVHRLRGEFPEGFGDQTPMAAMAELGIVEELIAEHPGRLEWHAPWHTTHDTDALLRGRVDPLAVDAWLTERGEGWLTLKDNGAIPATSRMTLDDDPLPPRVYHLMPRGITKGAAIAWDLDGAASPPRTPSRSATASATWRWRRRWAGCGSPPTAPPSTACSRRIDAVPNASITDAAMGEGWAQAVRASLRRRDDGGSAGSSGGTARTPDSGV